MGAKSASNTLDFICNWQLALNLSTRQRACMGYLLSFSGCGGLKLNPDIEVFSPIDSRTRTVVKSDTIKCVGIVRGFHFEGGEEDPISLSTYVSKGSAAEIRAKLARPLTNTAVKLSWYVVDFDPEAKLWYEAAFIRSPKEVSTSINSTGGDLQMFVDNQATQVSDTLDIGVYAFDLQVVPATGKQATLEFATGPRRRLVKNWGS